MRLKKSLVFFLVLLISVPMLAGIVHSATTPTITATTTGNNSIQVRGSSFIPNVAVDIFFDAQDTVHKVAQTLADYSGSFSVNFPIDGTLIGGHRIIAVQGSNAPIITAISLGTTSPPDDRLLNPINSINNYLQNDIGAKLISIDNKLNSIEEKLDNSNATQMLRFYSKSYIIKNGDKHAVITTDKPALFTVSIYVHNLVDPTWDKVYIYVHSPNAYDFPVAYYDVTNGRIQYETFTTSGTNINLHMEAPLATSFIEVAWTVTVQGTQGTVVTVNDPN